MEHLQHLRTRISIKPALKHCPQGSASLHMEQKQQSGSMMAVFVEGCRVSLSRYFLSFNLAMMMQDQSNVEES